MHQLFDSYHMDHAKGLMIVECRDSEGEEADLKNPACLRAVLKSLSRELRVDGLVLNHYLEKHYGRKTLDAMRGVLSLCSLLNQLAAQRPLPDFQNLSKKGVQSKCEQCSFSPPSLFRRLRDLFMGDLPRIDFPAFAAEFTIRASELGRHREAGCRNCVKRAADDLSFLLSETESFSDRILAPDSWRSRE